MSTAIHPSTSDVTENHSPLAWAAYLGASWTWCIGMFLPVLLIRDYGPWAWVIFAVPNCVGAAAMGWVMRSSEQSARYTRDHAFACRLFSSVTIAFQIFFAIWMLPRLVGYAGYSGALIVVLSAFLLMLRTKRILLWSMLTLVASVILAVVLSARGSLDIPQSLTVAPSNLLGLALTCVLGFLACPYLDLTFHHARQQTTNAGAKIAFGVGFCVFFASMIVFTFFYATTIFRMVGLSAWLLTAHLTLQLTFTVYVHAKTLTVFDASKSSVDLGLAIFIGLLAGVIAMITRHGDLMYHGLAIGEVLYRAFISFYGLVFPAYVCLAISALSPNRDEGKGRVSLIVWSLIVLLAVPFYWLAFIEAKMAWASVGVAIVIVGTVVTRAIKSPAPAAPLE